ncbi:aminomethyl-transferring glycine dehydrogenase subunit GcvPA [Streptomyces sp. NBC_00237]|uniref:aminomethyl-transferring glycine dehydrogenase subunit GcvPA n=1 Tax=Streptomyces sp. NBC_00237 TaxID=2975687 RepID=UPI00224EA710|nr:aminomethyl-transferring glycine dehydrogenase subunit GcvPA [Streptomyces sp. NBC_00237]MCX5202805.1 aminomethyl-transferring glycine dehydrogenase subunit GcvPA [Streptomyces sp. NBC_00237]
MTPPEKSPDRPYATDPAPVHPYASGSTPVHPYIPNSVPAVRQAMLEAVGASSVEDFYADIPEEIRLRRSLDLPAPLRSEAQLVRHMEKLLARNTPASRTLSFLGGGCYPHHVPAVVDEVMGRAEFLTAYAGEPYEDHGRFQTMWEYQSLMAELLDVDVVNVPVYDGFQAAGTALRMAGRVTGLRRLLISGDVDPDKLSKIRDYVRPDHEVVLVPADPATGCADVAALRAALAQGDVAALYAEAPSRLGLVDPTLPDLAQLAHDAGALYVVGCNPMTLGVLAPPSSYGADLTCGDIQPLGIRMSYGGGNAGFIGANDDERLVSEYPTRLFGLVPTDVEGEYGFGDVAYDRTSFALREEGKEWVGTAAALHGIGAGVYLSLMGPQGMRDIGETILAHTAYAKQRLAAIPGIEVPHADAVHFADFPVRYTGGRGTAEIHADLLERGIFGGIELAPDQALFCVTEVHTKADIDELAAALEEIVK